MTARGAAARFSLLACTAFTTLTLAMPAQAQDVVDIPTGAGRSPLLNGATPFTQKLLMYEELGRNEVPAYDVNTRMPAPVTCTTSPASATLDTFLKAPLSPLPREASNTSQQNPWLARINQCLGFSLSKSPIEGRPPGVNFAHQRFTEFEPRVYVQSATTGARTNTGLRDSMQRHGFAVGTEFGPGGLHYDSARGATSNGIRVRLHPKLPIQDANSVWTFDGTFPAKLIIARSGEPILFRHYNGLPIFPSANNSFGINQLSTHLHNGHSPGESDGYPGAYFFPGQFYDYRWPLVLSGHDRVNTDATAKRSGAPDGYGGVQQIRGDWRETMSTLWFHDHRIDHTAENVYKGMAGMVNIYSAVDRGNESLACHYADPENNVNLCLPSGNYLDWGNRDYDINLSVADKAWDATGQLYFNPFNTDGFLGDRLTVNWNWMPYMDVRPRRYRFRILNASVARYYKIALVTASGSRVPFHMVANDGNLMEHSVPFPNSEGQELPLQGIGERFDIIVDFSKFAAGTRLFLVNTVEHEDGSRPKKYASLSDAFAGRSTDPGVGKFLQFRVAAPIPGAQDTSMNPADYEPGKLKMINLPDFTAQELAEAKRRTFTFGRSNGTDELPWTIKTDGGRGLNADPKGRRISAIPTKGSVEVWTLISGNEGDTSGGWTHPVHVHFEEARVLNRDGRLPPVWETWARKDMFNVGRLASQKMEIALRFEDFLGSYVEHCHNTTHEDKAMLLRFDVNNPGDPMLIRAPLPDWSGVGYANSYILSE